MKKGGNNILFKFQPSEFNSVLQIKTIRLLIEPTFYSIIFSNYTLFALTYLKNKKRTYSLF